MCKFCYLKSVTTGSCGFLTRHLWLHAVKHSQSWTNEITKWQFRFGLSFAVWEAKTYHDHKRGVQCVDAGQGPGTRRDDGWSETSRESSASLGILSWCGQEMNKEPPCGHWHQVAFPLRGVSMATRQCLRPQELGEGDPL